MDSEKNSQEVKTNLSKGTECYQKIEDFTFREKIVYEKSESTIISTKNEFLNYPSINKDIKEEKSSMVKERNLEKVVEMKYGVECGGEKIKSIEGN